MEHPETESDFLEGFRNGDPEVLREAVMRYGPDLGRLMKLYTRRDDLAEDLVQEVFLRAYKKRELLVSAANFRAWLFTIARNIAAKEMKRHRYRLEIPIEEVTTPEGTPREFPGEGPSAAAMLQEDQTRRLLRETVQELDDDEREIISLRYFMDMPLREISDTLGIPMGSLGGKLNRALLSIRRRLEERGIKWDDLRPLD